MSEPKPNEAETGAAVACVEPDLAPIKAQLAALSSNCCSALVRVAGSGEGTHWHECVACGHACDVKPPNVRISDPAHNDSRLQPQADGRVRSIAWLGDTCEYCEHWEPDKTMLRPYRVGYCPLFLKRTDALHGAACTAHTFLMQCPKCGCQTRDPFGSGKVIHDAVECRGVKSPNKQVSNAPQSVPPTL